MSNLRLLIADDERLVRDGVRRGLAAVDDVEVVGECASGAETVAAVESLKPDLVLLDVQMQDCTGLDVVRRIGPERIPSVVFVTAYDEYAVAAFELNAVDYLLKPFDKERLRQSIQRARERIAARNQALLAEQLQTLLEYRQPKWAERIVVRNGERFDFIAVDAIDWIESDDNYVQLHCGKKTHFLSETLTHLERRLEPGRFVRIHRRRIINMSRLLSVHPLAGGTYEMELSGDVRLSTGRQYKDAVHALIRHPMAPRS